MLDRGGKTVEPKKSQSINLPQNLPRVAFQSCLLMVIGDAIRDVSDFEKRTVSFESLDEENEQEFWG